MKKNIVVFLVLICFSGLAGLGAQGIELPEPRFTPSLEAAPLAVTTLPDSVDGQWSELWSVNPGDAAQPMDFSSVAVLAAVGSSDMPIPRDVRNNQYFMESVRLRDLAKEAFDYGDYDSSADYAIESQRYARLSDEYVALQLKIRETDTAIGKARDRIAWAVSRGIDKTYPSQFGEAQGSYTEAVSLREEEQWDPAIAAAQKVLYILADSSERLPLPAQYTVRTWRTERDCLWNIAGYSWVYADPFQWKRLYEANRAKMPEPNNPDLIHPGTILDIPSIRGEVRQGMWQAGRSYNPLPPR
ncbi:MAG: LysM peptidoglycan-binding domain-containing protein [Spirochaetaceae bacterium]|jgi:nucleoid-associated protein YgaU|nr:LysM peptidoglycan-binding domain-containing protein [Spirochaetaceae bacterium]